MRKIIRKKVRKNVRKKPSEIGPFWTTADGRELSVSEMSNSHLKNTINFLGRRISEFRALLSFGFPSLNGEMAQICAESEYFAAEEALEEMRHMRVQMIKEQNRRMIPKSVRYREEAKCLLKKLNW